VNAVFADTYFWVALSDPSDPGYRDALAAESSYAGGRVVTTDEVLSEFLTFFSGEAWLRDRASRAVVALLNSPSVHVIAQSRETFLAGLELYRQRPDKGYSLTDCISMQTMRREGISDALTNDRHFEQEGFRAILRDA
jgi:uncharacterized protein